MKFLVKFISIAVLFMMFAICQSKVFGESGVFEAPEINIVIEGEKVIFPNVPIMVNDRTMLPFRLILNKLGVPNDEEYILWNSEEESVLIKYNGIQIKLKVNERNALVDGQEINLDAAPVIYKDRVYVPIRFISQSLGKKVIWDGKSNTVYIVEASTLIKMYDILLKVETAMNIKTGKSHETALLEFFKDDLYTKVNINAKTEINRQDKLCYSLLERRLEDSEAIVTEKIETGLNKNIFYLKNLKNGKLYKDIFSDEEVSKAIDCTYSDCYDFMAAGMNVSSEDGKLVLSGNVNRDKTVKGILKTEGFDDYRAESVYMEIIVNSDTYRVEKFALYVSGIAYINGEKYPFKLNKEEQYMDYNEEFEVFIPDYAK